MPERMWPERDKKATWAAKNRDGAVFLAKAGTK
jgi:hypothetical protein